MTDSDRHEAGNQAEQADEKARTGHDAVGGGDSGQEGGGTGSSRERSESWSDAHDAFERLSVEEKAFFLVESAFDTMVKGLREAGDAVKNAMDEALSDLEKKKREAGKRAGDKQEANDEDDGDAAGSKEDA